MICLVDCDHIAHRSYHALIDYRGAGGIPAGVVFGFVQSIKKIVDDLIPKQLVLCWGDVRDDLWRRKIYPNYKIKRQKSKPDFVRQVLLVRKLMSRAGFGQVLCPSFEADDVIAALCKESVKQKQAVGIVTGDHDLLQLVRDTAPLVRVYAPIQKGVYESRGEEWVMNKYGGLKPHQLSMFFSIVGERGDGISGVPFIGKERAKAYLQGEASRKVVQRITDHSKLVKDNLNLIDLRWLTIEDLGDSRLHTVSKSLQLLPTIAILKQAGLHRHSVINTLKDLTARYDLIKSHNICNSDELEAMY